MRHVAQDEAQPPRAGRGLRERLAQRLQVARGPWPGECQRAGIARRLAGDYYESNDLGTALAGRRGGRAYRLGDAISVTVERIRKDEGKVELSPAG